MVLLGARVGVLVGGKLEWRAPMIYKAVRQEAPPRGKLVPLDPTGERKHADLGDGARRVDLRRIGVGSDLEGRLEELHRAVRRRRTLRGSARGGRLQGRSQDQSRDTLVAHEAVRTGAIDIYPEYTGTGLNAVMKAARRDRDRSEHDLRVGAGLLREGVQAHLAETVGREQRLRHHRAAGDGARDEPQDALRPGQGRAEAEARRRTGIRRPPRRHQGHEGGLRDRVRRVPAVRSASAAVRCAVAEADRRRQRVRHRLADRGREVRGARRRQEAVPALLSGRRHPSRRWSPNPKSVEAIASASAR